MGGDGRGRVQVCVCVCVLEGMEGESVGRTEGIGGHFGRGISVET